MKKECFHFWEKGKKSKQILGLGTLMILGVGFENGVVCSFFVNYNESNDFML